MQTYLEKGIVLNSLNFRDFDQIITVFTENEGVIKLIAKGGNRLKKGLKNGILTESEFVYTIKKSELFQLEEVHLKESYLHLRQNYTHLTTACTLLKIILDTQMLQKPAPFLYRLLTAYLNKIPEFTNAYILPSSFRLKILQHEGVLNMDSLFFKDEEKVILQMLTFATSFTDLKNLLISDELNLSIKQFFLDTIC